MDHSRTRIELRGVSKRLPSVSTTAESCADMVVKVSVDVKVDSAQDECCIQDNELWLESC